ncbi:MAG: MFS transporter [Firmicutes bacterium]|nr:MFS transporter [Bacillota bacterium]
MAHTAKDRTQLWKRLFINRDYGLLFLGRLVSQIGDGIHYFALTWLVLDLTGSGTALGSLLMVSTLPGILLAPFAGVIVDTFSRKIIIVGADIIRGLLTLALAVIYHSGLLTMPILYVATVLLSLCGVVFGPAISATIPNLVKKEELVQANARDSFSMSATGILGPIVGAVILGATGYFGVFAINGICFILSGISEMFIRFPKQEKHGLAAVQVRDEAEPPSLARQFIVDFKQGFAYIWGNVGLRTMIIFALALNFMANPLFSVVFPYFAKEILQMEASHYGFTQSSFPAGLMLGTFLVGALTQRISKHQLLSWGIVGQGILVLLMSIIAFPVVHQYLSPMAILASIAVPTLFLGILNVQVNVPLNVALQESVPDNYRGRVFGLLSSLGQMLVPISMALFGILVDVIPTAYFLITCGIGTVVLGIAMGMSSSIPTLYEQPEVEFGFQVEKTHESASS